MNEELDARHRYEQTQQKHTKQARISLFPKRYIALNYHCDCITEIVINYILHLDHFHMQVVNIYFQI